MSADQPQSSPIEFPCDFTIKVMGHASKQFESQVVQIAKRHATQVHVDKMTKRHSKQGNYLSITLTVHVKDKAQLDALYIELSETPEVLMAL